MQLYDMHSHILPGIDDGAPSVEKSLVILNELKKQGVTNVCLTPHFYTNEISAEDFAAQETACAIDNLMPHIPDGMKVVVGAEVYVTRTDACVADELLLRLLRQLQLHTYRVCLHIAVFKSHYGVFCKTYRELQYDSCSYSC